MAPSCIHVSYLSTTRNETANLTAERMVFFLSTEAVRIMLNPISQIVQNWVRACLKAVDLPAAYFNVMDYCNGKSVLK